MNKQFEQNKEKYINNICSKIKGKKSRAEKRIESEKIINDCLFIRKEYLTAINKIIEKLRNRAVCIKEQLKLIENNNFNEKVYILCGSTGHTSYSESYFSETAYNFKHVDQLVVNESGCVENIIQLINIEKCEIKTWECSNVCIEPTEYLLSKYVKLINLVEEINVQNSRNFINVVFHCSNKNNYNKLGHSQACYIDPESCKSIFIVFEILSPHFPLVRKIKKIIYELKNKISKVTELDKAFNNNYLETLYKFEESLVKNKQLKIYKNINQDIELNETIIKEKNINVYTKYYKKVLDTPTHICASCDKFCYKRDVTKIKK